ncbi:metal ABC transporter permease [bacterium]|nr:metal ABC transporter permease [bacterium]
MTDILIFLVPPFLACAVILILLGYLGIHVIKREIIFIDIALAQIAAVGATAAHLFLGVENGTGVAYGVSFAFTVVAALFFAQIDKRITRISHEAIIGVTYAIAAAMALFILAMAAGGDIHMEHMLTGSILWATWADILLCSGLFAAVGLFHLLFRRRFIDISDNYQRIHEHATGKTALWDFLFYVSLGLVITFSVKIAGVLVIFSFLIIPSVFSALFADSWKTRILIAWGMGLAAVICGLLFSYYCDFSTGPSVIMFLGLFLLIAALAGGRKQIPRQENG